MSIYLGSTQVSIQIAKQAIGTRFKINKESLVNDK